MAASLPSVIVACPECGEPIACGIDVQATREARGGDGPVVNVDLTPIPDLSPVYEHACSGWSGRGVPEFDPPEAPPVPMPPPVPAPLPRGARVDHECDTRHQTGLALDLVGDDGWTVRWPWTCPECGTRWRVWAETGSACASRQRGPSLRWRLRRRLRP